MQIFLKGVKKNDSLKEERDSFVSQLTEEFSESCSIICPNIEAMTNILIDICYTSNKNKSFAWDVCGNEIFKNVLVNSNNKIQFPIKDENGDIEFCGNKFSLFTKRMDGDINDDTE